jgi:hypothetical protein
MLVSCDKETKTFLMEISGGKAAQVLCMRKEKDRKTVNNGNSPLKRYYT